MTGQAERWRTHRGAAGPLRVLLIEDEPADIAALEEAMAHWATVTTCVRLSVALEELTRSEFDVILLDLGLPDAMELSSLERIKRAVDLPVVVLTGQDTRLAPSALSTGAQDYLTKDRIDSELLLRSLHFAVERHSLQRASQEAIVERLSLEGALGQLLATTREPILLLDEDGSIVHASDAAAAVLEAEGSALLGSQPFADLDAVNHLHGAERDLEIEVAGERREVRARSFATRWRGRRVRGLVLASPDSERRATPTSAQLRRGDQLLALGQLTAEVAHEIGTPSSFVLSSLSLLEAELGAREGTLPPELLEAARDAHLGAKQIAAIVSDLRAVASAPASPPTLIQLDEVARAALNLLGRRVRSGDATITTELVAVPSVHAVEGRLVQVATNLLRNALDALEGRGGTIHIRTRRDGDVVVLEVEDDGPGLSDEARTLAFEPFFSTKPPSAGMGLGLTVSAELAGRHGGSVQLASRPSGGTIACLRMPVAEPGVSPRPRSGLRRKLLAGQRVLLVDDEPLIRRAYERMLGTRGCEVIAVESATQALAVLAEDRRFDLILCDVEMPVVNGPAFIRQLAVEAPELLERAVLCTGGLPPAGVPPGVLMLEKPIPLPRILELLGEMQMARSSTS